MINIFESAGGVFIECKRKNHLYPYDLDELTNTINSKCGGLFTSSFEFPGRYTCWDIGFVNPPLVITGKKNTVEIQSLNDRGKQLIRILHDFINTFDFIKNTVYSTNKISFEIHMDDSQQFTEEERSKQPSVFSVLRKIIQFFKLEKERHLGLYGAFGYDLIYQFEALEKKHQRPDDQRDIILYLPDELVIIDHRKEEAYTMSYEFSKDGITTKNDLRSGTSSTFEPTNQSFDFCDHEPGEYVNVVNEAKKHFKQGDLFEVVPSQTFFRETEEKPSDLFKRLKTRNPSPYGFLLNLGDGEFLIGASPEMFVRVQGTRIETCPISGTIRRGDNAIEDAEYIQQLLESKKECSELTMCTDVDRNDKSRICEPGSVQVIGRRQIEMYSRLIHTVDHVEGQLRSGFDALDAFLTHMWVVTVTGAPKLWAMKFIESHEKSPRQWYGGAVGWLGFDGNMNTGLVLRTIHLKDGLARVRVGATLLFDSVPEEEAKETVLKASALIDVIEHIKTPEKNKKQAFKDGDGLDVLLIDHEDSFVHTLANYIRQTGARVTTVRHGLAKSYLDMKKYDLVFLSPGPGCPGNFNTSDLIHKIIDLNIPIFGVCLGLQAIVEYFGGRLNVLDYPMHGKSSNITIVNQHQLFDSILDGFAAGRYHSLYADEKTLPDELEVTAISDDGIIMGVSHNTKMIHTIQFHPETILSLPNQAGLRIINNLMRIIKANHA